MDKNTLRKITRLKRDRMPASALTKHSKRITEHFIATFYPLIQGKGAVIIYLSTQSEARTKGIINYLHKQKVKLYSPCVQKSRIIPSLLSKGCRLIRGAYGIYEPYTRKKQASLSKIAAVIVPGIAFDMKGNRLGFGCGYFDRFLKKLPEKTVKVALAYSSQIVKTVPHTRRDVKMDYIITEKGVFEI